MFARYPKMSMTLFAGIISFPYMEKAMYPERKTFEDGRKAGMEEAKRDAFDQGKLEGRNKGYGEARRELRKLAEGAVEKTFRHIESDAKKLQPDIYLQEKTKIALLPKWNLVLLGDKYVVRHTLRAECSKAWLMTKSDSDEMDRQIETMLTVDADKIDIARSKVKQETLRNIDSYSSLIRRQN